MSETVTLGGGCFWCTEAVFQDLKGVESVESGYSGGTVVNPSYEQVCTGRTGHAEVVQVKFNPEEISLAQILEVFFTVHDPTTADRQGADEGPQYRSVIFYRDENQKRTAESVIVQVNASGIWGSPIVTQVVPYKTFYPAEEYHRNYFLRNPNQGYCRVVVAPKVAKFRQHYIEMLKAQ
jgi:peptide-methionine (S)-S-oxide reductase